MEKALRTLLKEIGHGVEHGGDRDERREYARDEAHHKGDAERGKHIAERGREKALQAELAAAEHEAHGACAAIDAGGHFAKHRAGVNGHDEERKQKKAQREKQKRHKQAADDTERIGSGRFNAAPHGSVKGEQRLKDGEQGDAYDEESDEKVQGMIAQERAETAAEHLPRDAKHAAQRKRADANGFIFTHIKITSVLVMRRHGGAPRTTLSIP